MYLYFLRASLFCTHLTLLMQSLTILGVASEHLHIAPVIERKALGRFETSNFTCAECNASEKKSLVFAHLH